MESPFGMQFSSGFGISDSKYGTSTGAKNSDPVPPNGNAHSRSSIDTGAAFSQKQGQNKANSFSEGIVPSTICMIEGGFKQSAKNDKLTLYGKSVGAVILTGWVVKSEQLASQVVFKLADGTGCIDVRFDTEGNNEKKVSEDIMPGRLIMVVGSARCRQANKENSSEHEEKYLIDAAHFKIIKEEFEEYACFASVEIAFSALRLRPPKGANAEDSQGVDKSLTSSQPPKPASPQDASWRNFELDEYAHITDPQQRDILKVVKMEHQRNAKVTPLLLTTVLKPLYSDSTVIEIAELLCNEGEIIKETDGSYGLL